MPLYINCNEDVAGFFIISNFQSLGKFVVLLVGITGWMIVNYFGCINDCNGLLSFGDTNEWMRFILGSKFTYYRTKSTQMNSRETE
jgi:hypothetical protein